MDDKSLDYTAFSTPFGSFKWLRMSMGLSNSPPTFQSVMEIVLPKLIWNTVVPYLDDCIIFAATPEEHLRRIREVLVRFRAAKLKINPLKCEFFRTKVQFLGMSSVKMVYRWNPRKSLLSNSSQFRQYKLMSNPFWDFARIIDDM